MEREEEGVIMVVKICPIMDAGDWIYCHDGNPSGSADVGMEIQCAAWDELKHVCRLIVKD